MIEQEIAASLVEEKPLHEKIKLIKDIFGTKLSEIYSDLLGEEITPGKALSILCFSDRSCFFKRKNGEMVDFKTYFIYDGNYVKIGKAINPLNRLSTLQCGNPNQLKLIHMIDGDSEKYFHNYFKDKKIIGEWFDLDRGDIKKIKEDY